MAGGRFGTVGTVRSRISLRARRESWLSGARDSFLPGRLPACRGAGRKTFQMLARVLQRMQQLCQRVSVCLFSPWGWGEKENN